MINCNLYQNTSKIKNKLVLDNKVFSYQ